MRPAAETLLMKRQTGMVAVAVLLSLLLVRLFARHDDFGFTVLLAELNAALLIAAVWSVFMRSWPTCAGAWVLGFGALLVGGLFLMELLDSGRLKRRGPGGIAFPIPVMFGFFACAVAGLIHLILWTRAHAPVPPEKDTQ